MSAVAELLALFRGTGDPRPELLVRPGRQLALAELELDAHTVLVDLDDPAVLAADTLRPSIVAGMRMLSVDDEEVTIAAAHLGLA